MGVMTKTATPVAAEGCGQKKKSLAYLRAAFLARGALVNGLVPARARVVSVHEAVREAIGSSGLTIPRGGTLGRVRAEGD
jgi:hypothetical protein